MTDALLHGLSGRFRETARIRLDEMTSLLARLDADPLDAESVRKLATHFHGLAGMGGTYGFPRVSVLGDEAEALIAPLVKRERTPDAATLARWREIVEEIRATIAAEPASVRKADASNSYRVLLIESDAALAEAIVAALAGEDVDVRRCTIDEATALLDERLPDAAIVASAAAHAFLDALRVHPKSERVGVIVTGDASDFAEKVRAIRSGADAFVEKPVDVAALAARVAALRERQEQAPRRILVVEDDPTSAALLRGVLTAAGYRVEICGDPAAFETMLLSFAPDLVLMDVQLGAEVSGHDLVRYVRQSERFATLPVIIVTSDSERRAVVEGANAGADLLVTKPVDWDLLLSQIATRLERAAAVRELTDRDPLTGVLTRSAFEARARQRVGGAPAALVLLDLDHFKDVNDTQGHIAGDRVLASLGALLRRRLRQTDLVARYGGEEFALLLDGSGTGHAVQLCEELLADFGTTMSVTFSAGVTTLDGSFDTAFRRADAALYQAKRAGRARVMSV
jgi:diguanylate cyclase (GGDEF)-like protein